MIVLDERYDYRLAAAYYRGLARRTGQPALNADLLTRSLDALTEEDYEAIVFQRCTVVDKLYYFKRWHEDMARIKPVLGFLRSLSVPVPTEGEFRTQDELLCLLGHPTTSRNGTLKSSAPMRKPTNLIRTDSAVRPIPPY